MKIIAYYLPQYHEIEENNEWWGKGFTEWTNVKASKKLYKKHNQPISPLDENYYNLMEKETVEWQTELANKYGIEGFCYYHYWFEGRKILEKPVENLLEWKDINQKFCFCWANHSWKKTWNGTMEMLIEQNYGDEEEWENHINYLLTFFKDDRYIKINNKPIFTVFLAKDIPNFDKRMAYYDEKCKQNGLEGIFVIESLNSSNQSTFSDKTSGVTLREPNIGITGLSFLRTIEYRIKRRINEKYIWKPAIFKSNEIYDESLKKLLNYKSEKIIIAGGFATWDSTPRHSKRGYIIENKNINDFKKYLKNQKKIMDQKGIEYIFFNAWNEWAEGMYLEPDEKNKYGYLEAIKEVMDSK
ncbi:MAG: glycosyltransferase WbsX family protein [Fusobacteriaceae bacterium]